jgi:hypothetical protein
MAKSRLIWLKRKEIDLQVDSKGFWRCIRQRITGFLDLFRHPVF